ncbi:DUF1016 N-terminal domain-containing protein [Rosistilla oblonga]|uniref:DUF1016 N-terminal domain-containing protein n=1 Tax=Rosistilla oblonga TaxID=2527990 RepID=UPI003A984725
MNSALVGLCSNIGKRIRDEFLQGTRAGCSDEIIPTLSRQLTEEFGRGFDRQGLFHMIVFAEVFPGEASANALRTQLSCTHFRELIAIDAPRKGGFNAEMCCERRMRQQLESPRGTKQTEASLPPAVFQ